MNPLVILLIIIIIALLLVVLSKNVFHLAETKLLFYPIKIYDQLPDKNYSYITLPSGATAWHFNDFKNSPTILYCHGNAANMSYWNHMIDLIHSQKINLFIFDYRGFGQSSGIPTIKAAIEDGIEAYDFLIKTVKPSNIIVWGESFGGVVALNIAKKHEIAYLALAATFSHPADVIREWDLNPIWQYPARLLKGVDNLTNIKKLNIPIVIIHSPTDEVIPYACALELYNAVEHPCKKLITIGGTHAKPKLSNTDLEQIFSFCCISTDYCLVGTSYLDRICQDCRQFCPFKFN